MFISIILFLLKQLIILIDSKINSMFLGGNVPPFSYSDYYKNGICKDVSRFKYIEKSACDAYFKFMNSENKRLNY